MSSAKATRDWWASNWASAVPLFLLFVICIGERVPLPRNRPWPSGTATAGLVGVIEAPPTVHPGLLCETDRGEFAYSGLCHAPKAVCSTCRGRFRGERLRLGDDTRLGSGDLVEFGSRKGSVWGSRRRRVFSTGESCEGLRANRKDSTTSGSNRLSGRKRSGDFRRL